MIVEIPTADITDWESFHTVSAACFGFPAFYGRSMDAWIDCLTYADEDDGMRNFHVAADDVLAIVLRDGQTFAHRCPEQYGAFLEGSAFVNTSRIEMGLRPIVAVAFRL